MPPSLKSIPIIPVILSVAFFSGCAHQPSQQETCPSTISDNYFEAEDMDRSLTDSLEVADCSVATSPSQNVNRGVSDRELGRFFGVLAYSVIEVVIRGIVYGLAHH